MTKKEMVRFVFIRSLGNFFLLLGLFGIVATLGPALGYEARFRLSQIRGIHFVVSPEDFKGLGKKLSTSGVLFGPKEQDLTPIDTQFSILIPKIAARAKIIPHVDPTDPTIFLPALQEGVAQAKGSVLPGMEGDVYLFAHSTDSWWNVGRYNAIFYLLKELAPGDQVHLFYQHKEYLYTVTSTVIKESNDTSLLDNAARHHGHRIILQTCWPPGTTWKRLYVIAVEE